MIAQAALGFALIIVVLTGVTWAYDHGARRGWWPS